MNKVAIITVGPSASGKSTFARNLVEATREDSLKFVEINLDRCRFLVSGDESNQSCTPEAVQLHQKQIETMAENGRRIVISDTNLNQKFRIELVRKLKNLGYSVEYATFDVPLDELLRRNQSRQRVVPEHVIRRHHEQMQDFLDDHQPAHNHDFVLNCWKPF